MTFITSKDNPLTAFGELLTAELWQDIQIRFDYPVINSEFVTASISGSGAVTSSSGFANLSTGTTTGSNAQIDTVNKLRYLNGMGADIRFTAIFDTPTANTTQSIGLFDDDNGYGVRFNGATFEIFRKRGGSIVESVTQSNFNVDHIDGFGESGIDFNPAVGNVFRIYFEFLGFGDITFQIKNPDVLGNGLGEFVTFHTIKYSNANILTSVFNPTLPFRAEADNGSTSTDITLKVASIGVFTQGREIKIGLRHGVDGGQTGVTTTLTNLVTVRNKTQVFTGPVGNNRVVVNVDGVFLASDGPKIATFYLYKNAAFGGALSYTNINANTSVIEYSTTNASVTVDVSKVLYAIPIGKADNATPSIEPIVLQPGDTLTLCGLAQAGGGGNDLFGGLSWEELF